VFSYLSRLLLAGVGKDAFLLSTYRLRNPQVPELLAEEIELSNDCEIGNR